MSNPQILLIDFGSQMFIFHLAYTKKCYVSSTFVQIGCLWKKWAVKNLYIEQKEVAKF